MLVHWKTINSFEARAQHGHISALKIILEISKRWNRRNGSEGQIMVLSNFC